MLTGRLWSAGKVPHCSISMEQVTQVPKTRKLQHLCRYHAKDLLWKSQYQHTFAWLATACWRQVYCKWSTQQACCKLIVEAFYPQVCYRFQQVVTKARKWQVATNVILTDLLQCDEIDKFVATCWQVAKSRKTDNLQQVCGVFGCVS